METSLFAEEVPVAAIHVANPRTRGQKSQDDLVESIRLIGLKRPITVARRRAADATSFDLICGQGRLEAFRKLGASTIPAVVLDLDGPQCLVRGLVENVARRQHSGTELVADVLVLRARGYDDETIGRKIGVSASWVAKIALLLEQGEHRLIAGVEAGQVPLSLAVVIACEPQKEAQAALAEAYGAGLIRPRQMAKVRRLLERRLRGRTPSTLPVEVSLAQVLEAFEHQAAKHRLELKRVETFRTQLAFLTHALADLWGDPDFAAIAQDEGMDQLPKALSDLAASHV